MGSTMSMVGLAALTLVMHISIHLHFVEQEELLCESTKEDLNQSISEIESLETEVKASEKQAESLETEIQELIQQNSNYTSLNQRQRAKLNQCISENKLLETELQTSEEKYLNCTLELQQAHTEISQLTQNQESSASEPDDAVSAFQLNSTILTDPTDIETFYDLLKPKFNETIGATDFKLNLLYRYTRDGSHVAYFHKKCDTVVNTLTLVESNYHNVFGGFTTKPWGLQPAGFHIDEKAFLYRSKSKFGHEPKIFDLKDPSHAVNIKSNYGPTWGGGHDLHLKDTTRRPVAYSYLGRSYEGVGNELCGGDEYLETPNKHWFTILEYEVYEVKAVNN